MPGGNADRQPPAANGHTNEVFKHRPAHHGIGQKGARAGERKYYLKEEERHERLIEGADFLALGASEPLQLSDRRPVTFGLCLKYVVIGKPDKY